MTRLRSALLGLLLPVLLIVWWELQGRANRLPDYLPPPSLFMREWLVMAADGTFVVAWINSGNLYIRRFDAQGQNSEATPVIQQFTAGAYRTVFPADVAAGEANWGPAR